MKVSSNLINQLFWVVLFALSMGFMESAVVIYLRKIYYPDGFSFPLAHIDLKMAIIEITREAATLIMLFSVGWIAGKKASSKFAFFILAFAVWDIFYYVFLKIILGWPESLMTWDILFLIPITWVGPVVAPIILSYTMIALAIIILYFEDQLNQVRINLTEWILLILGSLILIVGFCLDYSVYLLDQYSFTEIFKLSDEKSFQEYVSSYIPLKFNWTIYIVGESIIIAGILLFYIRNKKQIA